MDRGLLALEAARRQSIDWSLLPVTDTVLAAARDIAYAFGAVHPEVGTCRAIQAVLDQLDNPSTNQAAWEKHGAGRNTFLKWKKKLAALLGAGHDADAELAAALEQNAATLAEPPAQDGQTLQRSPSFLVGATSEHVL